jgi:hypothetical protein
VRRILDGVRNPIHGGCFSLIYADGLRISEAANLSVTTIVKASGFLRVVGKGDKERIVPVRRRIPLPHGPPQAVEISIRSSSYPFENRRSHASAQPSLPARYGRANSDSLGTCSLLSRMTRKSDAVRHMQVADAALHPIAPGRETAGPHAVQVTALSSVHT